MTEARIELARDWDWRGDRLLASFGPLSVRTMQFDSGTLGLRVANDVGEILMLPFQGQQIWDAIFHGRSLTMKTMFDQPYPTTDYMRTYGGFLIHCGATAMGPPGEGDDHPPHGELPNAPFDTAHVRLGSDERGAYAVVSGSYRHTVAFQTNYVFRPEVRLREGASVIEVALEVENLKQSPMELMYLAHANFRPVEGSRLHDNASGVRLRMELPSHVTPSAGFSAMFERLKQDANLHRRLDAEAVYDPEMVFFLDFEDAEAVCLAQHPDGAGDFIRYDRTSLPRCCRWISRTADQDCLGLALPGTAEPEGKTAERRKGNIVTLGARETWRCDYQLGAVDRSGARALLDGLGQASG